MARAHFVKSSRKPHHCTKGHEIPAGEGYYWAAPGYRGSKRYRCTSHPFRPSELTNSARSAPLAALEELEDSIRAMDPTDETTLEELATAVEAFAGSVREYADEREQALEAWENGNSQLEDLHMTAEQAAEEAEAIEFEEWGESEPDMSDYEDEGGEPDVAEYENAVDEYQECLTEHVQEQMDNVLDAAQSIEF